MYRFGKGYTLQVKIRLPDSNHDQPSVTLNKKNSHSMSRSSLEVSGSAARIPAGGVDPLADATKNFHNFVNEAFEDVLLIEEHQVRS